MIKVLVSTTKTQGQRTSDFCWVPEGEIVYRGFECDTDRDNIDGACGCRRSLCGVDSLRATTTFKVAPFDGSEDDWVNIVKAALRKGGWGDMEIDTELLTIAAAYRVGTVLEKRGDVIQSR